MGSFYATVGTKMVRTLKRSATVMLGYSVRVLLISVAWILLCAILRPVLRAFAEEFHLTPSDEKACARQDKLKKD